MVKSIHQNFGAFLDMPVREDMAKVEEPADKIPEALALAFTD